MQLLTKPKDIPSVADYRYHSNSDVKMRLEGTILRYRGKLIYVRSTSTPPDELHPHNIGLYLVCRFIDPYIAQDVMIHSSDTDLEVGSIPLGWIRAEGNVNAHGPYFIARTSRTQQKQGIHTPSLLVHDPLSGGSFMGWGWGDYQELQRVADCMNNKQFSLASAASGRGGPINQKWALALPNATKPGVFTVYHESIAIGTYFKSEKTFLIRRGRLTKTRKMLLQDIFEHETNKGNRYVIVEQP